MAALGAIPLPVPSPGLDHGVVENRLDTIKMFHPNPGEITAMLTAAGAGAQFKSSYTVEAIPGEIIIEIFKNLDLSSAICFSLANKRLREIFAQNRARIVLATLPSEFGPVDGLLRAATILPSDLDTPWGTWLDKEIRFKGKVLCQGKHLPGDEETAGTRPFEVRDIQDAEIDRVLGICGLVKGWERVFPRYRWVRAPECIRELTPSERYRLRGALYHWIRYDFYFHGGLPRPNRFFPGGIDPRCNYIRALSSGGQAELYDLWTAVDDAVRHLCPSLRVVRSGVEASLPEQDAARIAWGVDTVENDFIVWTMMKLSPERLLYYLSHKHDYSKARLIAEIRQQHPRFDSDVESLSEALRFVDEERRRACQRERRPAPCSVRRHEGGIIDWSGSVQRNRKFIAGGFLLKWKLDEDEDDAELTEMCSGTLEH